MNEIIGFKHVYWSNLILYLDIPKTDIFFFPIGHDFHSDSYLSQLKTMADVSAVKYVEFFATCGILVNNTRLFAKRRLNKRIYR